MGWLLLSVNVSKHIFGLAVIAQLGECKTENLKVLGSIPGGSMVIMIKYMSELFEFEIFLNHLAMSSTKSNSKI